MDKREFLTHWEGLQEKMEWPDGLVMSLYPFIDKIFANKEIADKCEELNTKLFANTWNVEELVVEVANQYELDINQFKLFLCLYNSYTMLKKYIAHEWPMDIYYDSLSDIIVWANCCYKRYGYWGLYEYGWLVCTLKCELFKLGRLQFRIGRYTRKDYECNGVVVKNGSRVIDMHIPEGDSITREKRIDAYKKAYKFFNQTGNAVFVCHSWLFYEKHRDFLPATSNIIDFMNDFDYIEKNEYKNWGDFWRIFGWPEDDEHLPRETALQKGYAEWLKTAGLMGDGYGIFIFDGEKVINNTYRKLEK